MEAAHLHVYGTGPLFFIYSVSESVVCCSTGVAPSFFQYASSSTILTPSLSCTQFLRCNTTVGLENIHAVFEGAFPMASNRRWWDRYLDVRTMEIRSGQAYLAFAQELQRTLSILTEVHHWAGFSDCSGYLTCYIIRKVCRCSAHYAFPADASSKVVIVSCFFR